MSPFVAEAAAFALRWLHVVAAIAWIGESFYFVMLDRSLAPAAKPEAGAVGESWSVHGGGFYLKRKFMPAPPVLPEVLHWSKWKSYATWLSGFALFCAMYLAAPKLYLIDPEVMVLSEAQAVAAAVLFLAVAWMLYDLLCRVLGFREDLLGAAVSGLVLAMCWVATQVFAGGAAFLIVGAALGTIMSANVFFVIIPGQKRLVSALARGEAPDPLAGQRGKQRSVHNTYFTLPVVFAMLSHHYAIAYAGELRWLVLALFLAAGALIRQFFVLWHSGQRAWWLLGGGGVLLLAAFAMLAPRAPAATAAPVPAPGPTTAAPPTLSMEVTAILARRCTACHSAHPTMMGSPPKGVVFDTPEQVELRASRIYAVAAQTHLMPPGNATQMTDEERAAIAHWFQARPQN